MFNIKKISLCIIWIFILSAGIVVADSQNFIDEMDFLNQEQINNLQSEIETIQQEYLIDVVIVITDDTQGKSSMAFADDYFDYNGYGIGKNFDGILLLVNMDARELWISTTGSQTINRYDASIDAMIEYITPHLSEGNYYEASLEFIGLIDRIENSEGQSSTQAIEKTFFMKIREMLISPIPYILGVVIASISTIAITVSSKGNITVTNRTYESPGSFKLERKTDRYIRENIHRVKIETKSSSGSGSHMGSSGRSHGGGGGHF